MKEGGDCRTPCAFCRRSTHGESRGGNKAEHRRKNGGKGHWHGQENVALVFGDFISETYQKLNRTLSTSLSSKTFPLKLSFDIDGSKISASVPDQHFCYDNHDHGSPETRRHAPKSFQNQLSTRNVIDISNTDQVTFFVPTVVNLEILEEQL